MSSLAHRVGRWLLGVGGGAGADVPTQADPDSREPSGRTGPADAKTVRLSRSASAPPSWPARDQASRARPREERPPDAVAADEAPTYLVGEPPFDAAAARGGEARSRPLARAAVPESGASFTRPAADGDDVPTRLVQAVASDDPVVGWLVVVDGPGRGRSVEIGPGANPVGRAAGQKLRLDFGDDHISRERHAVLVFDPIAARFFLHSGEGRNLAYVDGAVLMAPVELKGGETIRIGDTQLRFVPFCGANFRW